MLDGLGLCGPSYVLMPARRNVPWWEFWVVSTVVREVPEKGEETDYDRFWSFKGEENVGNSVSLLHPPRFVKTTMLRLQCPPDEVVRSFLHRSFSSFTEVRQDYSVLPRGLIPSYHSFTLLDVGSPPEMSVLLERKGDKLELMFGFDPLARGFMKQYRALARPRNPKLCYELPSKPVHPSVTVCNLLEWIDGPLAQSWELYNMLDSNCQHFTKQLQSFLQNPPPLDFQFGPSKLVPLAELQNHRMFVLHSVRRQGTDLQHVPENFRSDWRVVLEAVASDGLALQHAPEGLRSDRDIVAAACRQNGLALQYATNELQADKELVALAVNQNPSALQYADKADFDTLLSAGQRDPLALRFAFVRN
mmetsp:Transcript_65990/g.127361  ORF Transcript_65990/g.127361 Transcript_65990/m.127361 type:complete len:362 (-) Transcript_65990:96-1181(-)